MISVPHAKVYISSRTLITSDMIGTKEVAKNIVDNNYNVITSLDRIIGKYVRDDKVIEEEMLFETSLLMTELEPSDLIVIKTAPSGTTVFGLPVSFFSSFYNSIMPGDKIDIYIQALNENCQNIYVKMLENVEILQTRDANGNNAFGPASNGVTSEILFAVPDQYFHTLLNASINAVVFS